jgi:hypothetical protein
MKMTKPENRVKARKFGGDDAYSWAVFVDGRMFVSGESKQQAQWLKKKFIKELEEKEGK